jgi:hypothetical protein
MRASKNSGHAPWLLSRMGPPYFGNALILGLYPAHNTELLVTY